MIHHLIVDEVWHCDLVTAADEAFFVILLYVLLLLLRIDLYLALVGRWQIWIDEELSMHNISVPKILHWLYLLNIREILRMHINSIIRLQIIHNLLSQLWIRDGYLVILLMGNTFI